MMADKRRRTILTNVSMSKRRSIRSIKRMRYHSKKINEVPGLFQVKISPSLQNVLGCRVGINLTSSNKWMYVCKQKLLEELESRQSNVDKQFLRIRAEIRTFLDKNILIGSCGGNHYLLCLSQYARDVCENWKEEERKKLMDELMKYLSRESFYWNSLGSDWEVERVKCIRDPLCVQLKLQPNANAKFSLRLVNDAKDGYAEFVNTRTTFNCLYRKRVDAATQASSSWENKQTQTTSLSRFNRSIQYAYSYPELKTSKSLQHKLREWFTMNYSDISGFINYNASINIYINDYMDLPNQKSRYSIKDPNIITSFYDCISCQNKIVSCIEWNSQISDIVAVAYNRICSKFIVKKPPVYRRIPRKETETSLVLIWSIAQPSKPFLYLQAPRDVTAMKFCPYDRNILVGGCADGQVLVWDLNGKLDGQKKDGGLMLSAEVTMMIKEKMAWMKNRSDEQSISPCVQSRVGSCHKSPITVVKWFPPEYELNKLGEFVKYENERRMQFLTAAVSDSTMLVWDLKSKSLMPVLKNKNSKQRLSSRPRELDEKESPFSELNTSFKPIFNLIFAHPLTKRSLNINDIMFNMGSFCYSPTNPETASNDELHKTIDTRNNDAENFQLEKKCIVATEFGELYHCSWESSKYDGYFEINMQNVDTTLCKAYHDGPIHHIQRNPYYSYLILTTGGRVFAVWDIIGEHFQTPLLWRKAKIRYVMAMWSSQNSASIIAARADGKIELWDFEEQSKLPLRLTKVIGNELLSLYYNSTLEHVMKGTCITTDLNGTLYIYDITSNLFVQNRTGQLPEITKRIYERRNTLKYWNDYVMRQRVQIDNPDDSTATENETVRPRSLQLTTKIKQLSFEMKKTPENKWQEKEYKRMYDILIEKHRINLAYLEKNKGPLDEFNKNRYLRIKKINRCMANKEKIFQQHVSDLTRVDENNSKKSKMSVHFPKELEKLMKDQYLEDYKNSEAESLQYIKCHRHR